MTHWQDLDSVGFFYRKLINSNLDMKVTFLPIAASFVVQYFRDTFSNESEIHHSKNDFNGKSDIPVYSTNPEKLATLHKISQIGTPAFIHPVQNYSVEGRQKKLQLVTGVQIYPVRLSKAKQLIWDLTKMPEYNIWENGFPLIVLDSFEILCKCKIHIRL